MGFLALAGNVALAQDAAITVDDTATSAGRIFSAIQSQTDYKVAYTQSAIDTAWLVTLPAARLPLNDALDRLIAGRPVYYVVDRGYIAFLRRERSVFAQHTGEARRSGRPSAADGSDRTSAAQNEASISGHAVSQNSAGAETAGVPELPAPYSSYDDPDTYTPIRNSLPRWSVKSNLLYGALALAPNIGVEMGLDCKSSIELSVGFNGWNRSGNSNGNKKMMHYIVRPEYRRWLCERYNGHFFGVHAFHSLYNVSGHDVPLLFEKDYRYEGWALGAGVTYGYQLPIAKRWSVEFNIGIGAAYLDYERFACGKCGTAVDEKSKFYFGPTRAGISAVFIIK